MAKIPRPDAMRILYRLTELQRAMDRADTSAFDLKALQGHHARWRLRIGDYRVTYTVENDQLIIWVLAAGHRRDVYRNL